MNAGSVLRAAAAGRSVSVVIPTYNLAHLLPEAVASARAQAWPGTEIIVVDDGSTDGTPQVLERLSAGGGLRWFRQENAGAAEARNRGVEEARGEWVAFLDADDFWLPGKLAAQFEELAARPDAAFSYTGVRVRREGGEEYDLRCGDGREPLFERLLRGNVISTPTALVRRDCFDAVGPFDARLRTGEDWDMWLRLAARFASVAVARPLSLVRAAGAPKFPARTFEECTERVLERLFSSPAVGERRPGLASERPRVYAWHYSVIAKSYLRQGAVADFCRLAYRAVRAHTAALGYLAGVSHF